MGRLSRLRQHGVVQPPGQANTRLTGHAAAGGAAAIRPCPRTQSGQLGAGWRCQGRRRPGCGDDSLTARSPRRGSSAPVAADRSRLFHSVITACISRMTLKQLFSELSHLFVGNKSSHFGRRLPCRQPVQTLRCELRAKTMRVLDYLTPVPR
jgi:hypothetical protein